MIKKISSLFLFSCLYFISVAQYGKPLLHEFRGVWVATVNNIDWPSARNLPVEQQKQELIKLLDMHKKNGMNAIFFQVRPSGDAFYASSIEPWSIFLNGQQGTPPTPFYDPLAFVIEECHKRNMELHAWLNPYRAVFKYKDNAVTPNHITVTKPEWFITYGDHKYFNPALKEVRVFICKIIKDIIDRYSIDGIHIDDYFYPYPIPSKQAFPDDADYIRYGNGMPKDVWRRSNCDSIVKNIWDLVNEHPKRVKFGISPFGVWRNSNKDPQGSATKAGMTNYDDISADIKMWLQKGWMDYCVPQLYWEINHPLCDYNILLNWWNNNTYGRHLYIGHGIYKAGTKGGYSTPQELPNEIQQLRYYKTTQGSIYFSSKTFETNPNGWCDSLQNNYYKYPALPPTLAWLKTTEPYAPKVCVQNNQINIASTGNAATVKGFIILVGHSPNNAVVKQIFFGNNFTSKMENLKTTDDEKLFIASFNKNYQLSSWVQAE